MTDSDWDRLQDLFHRASGLGESERPGFLDEHCADDEQRTLLEAMLKADSEPPRVLDMQTGQMAEILVEPDDDLPKQIGPYTVDRLVGRGGMGIVVLAERPDLPRKVALKLLRDRWLGSEAVRRFQREQSALARLQHPNIARLLNVGTTEDGRPYLTMDFVEGKPVNEYCSESDLSIDDRLHLVVDICEAVRYAHQNLVVHRDLKPSNILVDREGRVRLLDFGIAKLLEEETSDPETVTSDRLMTPLYASPEQLGGRPVTTSTDVYSLGVVACELLTGRRPHDLEGKSATEALRILTEEAPKRPSTTAEDELDRRGLRGDLDNILLKALQRDPDDRYASVEAMLADIRRHLEGFPVEAREATAAYRTRKFVSRHKIGVGVALGIVVLLTGFATTVAIQQAETARERDRAEYERDRAEREAARAERTTDFLIGLFEASDPAQTLGDTVSAKELLERGIEQAEALVEEPILQAETYEAVGRVYRSLGQNDRSAELLERAVDIRRNQSGAPAREDLAAALRHLAEVYSSSRRNDDAIRVAEEALSISRSVSDPPSEGIALGLNSLGVALSASGKWDEADSVLQLSYAQLKALGSEDSEASIKVLANRLDALENEGRHGDAEPIARMVLDWRRQNLPPNHPETAEAVDFLAVILRNLARYEEAEPLYEEAIAVKTEVYGPDHPSTAASVLNLAIFHGIQGHYEEAEPYFKRSVEMYRSAYGPESPRTAQTMAMYAVLLGRTGRFDESADLFRKALNIQSEKLGPAHPNTIGTELNLGITLCDDRRFAEGVPIIRRAVDKYREAIGPENPRFGDRMCVLGLQEALMGQHETGISHSREGYEIVRSSLGDEHQMTARGLGFVGRALVASDRHAEADSILQIAYRKYTAHVEPDDPTAVAMADAMGQAKTHLGAYAEADSLLRAAYDVRVGRLGIEHPWTIETAQHIRELYAAWGRNPPSGVQASGEPAR